MPVRSSILKYMKLIDMNLPGESGADFTIRSLMDAIPESMFIMDRQGVILEANDSFLARFGKSIDECIGLNVYDLLPPDVAAHRRKKLAEVLRTGKRISFFGEVIGDSLLQGRKIHHLSPLFGSDGEINRLVVFSQDITELKRTEENLTFAQSILDEDLEAMSKLHEISTLFVREGDINGVYEKVIDAALVITGAEMASVRLVNSVTGHLNIVAQKGFTVPVRECCHDSTVGECLCDMVLRRKEQITVEDITESSLLWGKNEVDAHLADGVRSLQLTPLVSRNGELFGILTIYFRSRYHANERVLKLLDLLASQTTDIVEKAEKEEAIRQSEEQLRLAQEAAKSGSWEWDCITGRSIWSEELWSLYGLDRQGAEPSCELWTRNMHPDDCQRVRKVF